MQRKFWFPKTMPERLVFFTNFRAKIATHQAQLDLTLEQVAAMEALADGFIAAFMWAESCKASLRSAIAWRDNVYESVELGAAIPSAPVFPEPPVMSGSLGMIRQMYAWRDLITSLPGYSAAIGTDLRLIGPMEMRIAESDVEPELQPSPAEGNSVNIIGSMQKMNAMRVEYKTGTGSWQTAAFLTHLPAKITIPPTEPGRPEKVFVRSIFIRQNADYGSYSPEYPVTLF